MTFSTEAEAREFMEQIRAEVTPKEKHDLVVIPTTHGHWVITAAIEAERPAKKCSICQQPFREFSNNAKPVNSGRCCAFCDQYVVWPARSSRGVTQ